MLFGIASPEFPGIPPEFRDHMAIVDIDRKSGEVYEIVS
jgi:hypothetical protein